MIPPSIANFYMANQEVLWLTTLALDLAFVVLLFRLFGKAGLMVAISTAIILANLQGPKLTVIFGMETSLGVIFYSSIFFATDVLSENYGRKAANKAVWMGFTVSVIVVVMLSFALMYMPSERPASAEFSRQIHEAFETIVGFAPNVVFGSLFAYIVSQSFDVWAFHRIKKWTGERNLWLRNNLSTLSSQFIDTMLFSLVVWAPLFGILNAAKLGVTKYGIKIVISLIDTPFIYWARYIHRSRRETAAQPA